MKIEKANSHLNTPLIFWDFEMSLHPIVDEYARLRSPLVWLIPLSRLLPHQLLPTSSVPFYADDADSGYH